MWTEDVNDSIICNYRGFDIFKIGSGFAIKQFSFFKWPVLQDAIYHIDRHCGGGKGTIIWRTISPPRDPNIKENPPKLSEKEILDIKEIYNKVRIDIGRGELKIVTEGLLMLIRECYSKDIIDNKFIDGIKDNLDKLEKVMNYISSDNNNESNVANDKSLQLCNKILVSINNVAKIDGVISCKAN